MARAVITALTAQNTRGVTAIHDVPPSSSRAQIDAVFSDLAVERGEDRHAVRAGVDRGGRRRARPLAAAQRGARSGDDRDLGRPAACARCDRRAQARADPARAGLTPNLPEAAALLDAPLATNRDEMREQAERLLKLGATRGADQGRPSPAPKASTSWSRPMSVTRLVADRIVTKNTHGTGCTLSSAIAAGLAKGRRSAEAVTRRQDLRDRGHRRRPASHIGSGHGPVHHFHAWW